MYKQLCTQSCSTQSKTVRVHKEKTVRVHAMQYAYCTQHATPPPPSAVRSVRGWGGGDGVTRSVALSGKEKTLTS